MRLTGMRVPHEPGLALFRHWRGLGPKARAQSVAGTFKRMLRLRLWRRVRIEDPA
jgi:coenzyme F420 hydrogenase subunit beta